MIVKIEATTLAACLASVQGIVDEILVVDTGSSDPSKDIARQHGARVFDLAWPDSFAAARRYLRVSDARTNRSDAPAPFRLLADLLTVQPRLTDADESPG
jgi:glycosyltransferase involved in cell wall biosynthesis